MNKQTDDQQLRFVLSHYQPGKLDTQKALRRVAPPSQSPKRRWVAAAASVAVVVAVAATLFTTHSTHDRRQTETDSMVVATTPPADVRPAAFVFNDTPLPEVLQQLGHFYGVSLKASDESKHLTGQLDTLSLEQNIEIIEQVLDVRISRQP